MKLSTGLVPKAERFLKKSSPTILTCISAVGVVATAVLAAKATPKAVQLIRDNSRINHDGDPNAYSKKELLLRRVHDVQVVHVAPVVFLTPDVFHIVVNGIRVVYADDLRELVADVHGFLHKLFAGELAPWNQPVFQLVEHSLQAGVILLVAHVGHIYFESIKDQREQPINELVIVKQLQQFPLGDLVDDIVVKLGKVTEAWAGPADLIVKERMRMLSGNSNEEKIWNFLRGKGLSDAGTAGLMGNLYAESGLRPNNLQNSYEGKLGMTDTEYTERVDKGTYTNFARDGAGYGLCQWTFWSRKQNLLEYTRSIGKSIGDLEAQLAFLIQELSSGYKALLNILKTATSVRTASDAVLTQFERPADQSEAVKIKRAEYGQVYYGKYVKGGKETVMGYTNSPLVTYTRISPNRTSPRTHAIDTITIHCIVGQWTAKQGCDYFASTGAQASANYVVGKDGSVGLCVEEKDRSWCSSNSANDHRAVTMEVASDTAHPYAVTDKALQAVIDLCEDICRRYGKTKLLWFGDKEKTLSYTPKQNEMVLTVHRWFANKACPGEYLYARQGMIADEVTKRLNEEDDMNIDKMTDADVLKLYTRMQNVLGKQPVSATLSKELAAAKAAGITDGSNPGALCTRAQAAVMTYRATKK